MLQVVKLKKPRGEEGEDGDDDEGHRSRLLVKFGKEAPTRALKLSQLVRHHGPDRDVPPVPVS